jgi:hypothetical protein
MEKVADCPLQIVWDEGLVVTCGGWLVMVKTADVLTASQYGDLM